MSVPFVRALLVSSLLLGATSFAEEITPKKAAAIQRDREKEMAEVQKKYGNKKLSELSNAERRAMAKDQAEVEKKVLDKHGVGAKEWARHEVKASGAERAETARAADELKKKDEADAKAAAAKKNAPKEIEVQRGFSEDKPTTMEAKEGAPPVVEHGLPAGE